MNQEQPPATGEEYLRKVVREANKLKFATTAENADQLLNKGSCHSKSSIFTFTNLQSHMSSFMTDFNFKDTKSNFWFYTKY